MSASAKTLAKNGATSYPEAIKFLDAFLDGVPDTKYLEIRTLKKGRGGGIKEF